MLELANVHKAL